MVENVKTFSAAQSTSAWISPRIPCHLARGLQGLRKEHDIHQERLQQPLNRKGIQHYFRRMLLLDLFGVAIRHEAAEAYELSIFTSDVCLPNDLEICPRSHHLRQ